MISAGDFRNGITIELDNNVYQIIEFQHVKPGKGAAFVRTKLKNIKSGGVVEKTFRPTEKCPQARIDRKDMQYLYSEGDMYNFMDKLVSIGLPRVRDFRGVSPKAFDGRGNYTLGIKEQLIFPEVDYDQVIKTRGLDIVIVTTAKTNEEAFDLLSGLGIPFRK